MKLIFFMLRMNEAAEEFYKTKKDKEKEDGL